MSKKKIHEKVSTMEFCDGIAASKAFVAAEESLELNPKILVF